MAVKKWPTRISYPLTLDFSPKTEILTDIPMISKGSWLNKHSVVLSVIYCGDESTHSDWPRHEEDCLAARERRGLFDSAKRIQRSYHVACDMGLDFAVRNGYKIGNISIEDGNTEMPSSTDDGKAQPKAEVKKAVLKDCKEQIKTEVVNAMLEQHDYSLK